MTGSAPEYRIDPDDPRAPSTEVWNSLDAAEKRRIVGALPPDMPLDQKPPEGDAHRKPKNAATDALDAFFRKTNRHAYVSSELVVYYPDEPRFCPDVLVVFDVPNHERSRWVVSDEGKGLDFILEIHVSGERKKDFERNVRRFAALGIPEYWIFDQPNGRLLGHRLPTNSDQYERVVPQGGRFNSQVLGLDLTVEAGRVRFYYGTAPLLFADELGRQAQHHDHRIDGGARGSHAARR